MNIARAIVECLVGGITILLIAGPFLVGSAARFFWLACEMGWHKASDWSDCLIEWIGRRR